MPIFGVQPAGLLEVFEDIGAGIGIIDHQGMVVFANKVCVEMFDGRGSDSPVAFREWYKSHRFEDGNGHEIPYDDFPVTRALKGEAVEPLEFQVKLPNGNTRWLSAWAYPFSTMGLSGVLAIIVDLTEQVELREAAAQLQRMELLGVLAAGIAHDFNNLLSTISSNVALALDSPDEIHSRLQQISTASEKAAGLVRRLMQFSRTQELDIHTLQLNNVVRDSLHLVKSLISKNVDFTTKLLEALPAIEADRSQMEQLVINLILNALEAMPCGGRLTISTTVATNNGAHPGDKPTQSVVMSVADTGVGIPLESQRAIFEPFFTTKPAGTGLGLSSAYGIVRQHGGDIKVDSVPGKGATFTVVFPVKTSP